ncbi:hypothetical protein TNCV_1983281 [Trichonephila clavipes]|nr:hypothetical protein TNCV_1983281 [Trichonephila clavipes]
MRSGDSSWLIHSTNINFQKFFDDMRSMCFALSSLKIKIGAHCQLENVNIDLQDLIAMSHKSYGVSSSEKKRCVGPSNVMPVQTINHPQL